MYYNIIYFIILIIIFWHI